MVKTKKCLGWLLAPSMFYAKNNYKLTFGYSKNLPIPNFIEIP